MSTPETKEEYIKRTTRAELWDPTTHTWLSIRKDIMTIEKSAFDEQIASSEERLQAIFELENATIALLKNSENKIIGYTCAYPQLEKGLPSKKTVYIESTAILPEYQGFKLVGLLMNTLEKELKRKGFSYMERDSMVDNGYADSISRSSAYHGRILESYDWFNSHIQRMQRHFKISL